jgi:hypothetical protein
MRHAILKLLACAMALMVLSIGWTSSARADRFDDIAASPMSGGRPTAAAAKSLKDEMLFQRATQVYLWALPLINTLGMKYGSEHTFGASYNVLPIWKDRLSAKTLITTPNSDVLYAMSRNPVRITQVDANKCCSIRRTVASHLAAFDKRMILIRFYPLGQEHARRRKMVCRY